MAHVATENPTGLDHSYAQSLVELAVEQDQLDVVAQEASQLLDLLREQPDLRRLFVTRSLSNQQRRDLITSLFDGRISELLYKFVHVISEKGRLNRLDTILQAVLEQVARREGRIDVEAFVASSLSDDDSDRLARQIGEALGKTVVLKQTEAPELIGGMKLRFEDRIVDGSVATQLKRMKQELIRTGRQRVRGQAPQAS